MPLYSSDYLKLVLKIHRELCHIKTNDYGSLIRVNKSYVDLIDRIEKYHIFNLNYTKTDQKQLKEEVITNFNEHLYLISCIIRKHFTLDIIPNQDYPDNKQVDFLLNLFNIDQLKLEKSIGIFTTKFEYDKNKGIIVHNKTIDKEEFANKIKDIKNNQSKIKIPSPLNIVKLKKSDIEYIESLIKIPLQEYKSTINKYFYQIRNSFHWYNKEIIIYTRYTKLSNAYPLRLHVLNSSSSKIRVFPYQLKYFSQYLHNNYEEIPSLISFGMSGYIHTDMDSKSKNFFHLFLNKYEAIKECFELFWYVSNFSEKNEFYIKIFSLFGLKMIGNITESESVDLIMTEFVLTSHDHFKRIIDKMSLTQTNKLLFVKSLKLRLSEKEIILLSRKIKSNNWKKDHQFVFTFGVPDSYPNEFYKSFGIKVLTINELVTILSELGTLEFIYPFLIEIISKRTDKKLLNISAEINNGKILITELSDIIKKDISWREFEKLMEKVIDYLLRQSFKYYFAKPQLREYDGLRRPDLVIHNNYPLNEFWKMRKSEEHAKRILIDFKDYNKPVNSGVIDDVSKYLNNKLGNFAIVISKYGLDKSGKKIQKKKYFEDDQLIIDLDIDDLIEMIHFKINHESPEDLLEKKLSEIID